MSAFQHKVRAGDCIASIAFENGFFPDTIWNDSSNSELKDKRKDPNVLMPGDLVSVPAMRPGEQSCESGAHYKFKRRAVPEQFIVQFKIDGQVLADAEYTLEIDGDRRDPGKTDQEGYVKIPIPPNARCGKLVFKESGDEYEFALGGLDPIDEVSGVQGRLKNLGYFEGEVDGKTSDDLTSAINAFQVDRGLEATGEVDDSTRSKLEDAGSP